MNKFLYILFFVALLVVVGYVASLFLGVDGIVQVQEDVKVDIPEENITYNPNSSTMLVRSRSGRVVQIPNIVRNADDVGGGAYIFAGGLSQPNPRYVLTYFESYDFFQVSLEDIPLDQVRLLAEDELRIRLGVSDEILCDLDISVRTRIEVSYEMTGKELGLSFCDGSVSLREGASLN